MKEKNKWWKDPQKKKKIAEKISKSVKKRYSWDSIFGNRFNKDENGCFVFVGPKNPKGYGRVSYRGKVHGAHRLSYILAKGPIKSSQIYVCHKCDNPSCINPEHLWLGTHAENMNDMMSKGRGSISRLSVEDKKEIIKSDMNMIELSKKYKVPTRVISFIINNNK